MVFETFEPRRLMSAVTAVQVGSTLLINGTSAADVIRVEKSSPSDTTRVTYLDADRGPVTYVGPAKGTGPGTAIPIDDPANLPDVAGFKGIANIVLTTGGGDDNVVFTVDGARAVISTGAGDDALDVAASNDTGASAATAFYVDAGAGSDTLTAAASGNSLIVASTGSGNDYGSANANNGGQILIDTGADNDGDGNAWSVNAFGPRSLVVLNLGGGNDWAGGSAFDGGVVVINGEAGDDHLSEGTAESGGSVTLNGGAGNDLFEINIVNAGSTVTVDGGAGSDTATVLTTAIGTLVIKKNVETVIPPAA